MSHSPLCRPYGVVALGLLLGLTARPAAAQRTYLAVGDSVAFGYQDQKLTPLPAAPPFSTGFAGYAQPYAATLSARAGAPVTLVNLGIVGETAASLVSASANTAANGLLNGNYSVGAPQTQYALLTAFLTAPGADTTNITVQVGANDVLNLAATPAFEDAFDTGDSATVQKLLAGTLADVGTNYDLLLGQIHALAPSADVQVLGYYDPYAALTGLDPVSVYLRAVSAPLNQALNAKLAQEALAHGDRFVDLAGPFTGHEATLTLSGELVPTAFGPAPNDHPSAAGYALIASQLAASPAPVPESSGAISLGLLLLLGAGGVVAAARKKRGA